LISFLFPHTDVNTTPTTAATAAAASAPQVEGAEGHKLDLAKYPIGSQLEVAPWHACSAAHAHKSIFAINKDNEVIAEWVRARGWGA
jgi:hypothetical protein